MSWKRLKTDHTYRALIEKRFLVNRAVREFFWNQQFLEVETPLFVAAAGQEPYLHPFTSTIDNGWGKKFKGFFITSPEYAMKKLLVGGFTKIFHLSKVFRGNEEFGGTHNPEFTMIEWYRAHEGYRQLGDDIQELVRFVAQKIGETAFENVTFERISMKEIWKKYVNVNLDDYLTRGAIVKLGVEKGYPIQETEMYEDVFFRIFLNEVEMKLVEPTIIYEYPKALASLARECPENPAYVERIEAYMGGVELANGFGELTDAGEQRRRFVEEHALRKQLGNEEIPIDEDFLRALEAGMPEATGIALGIDRLAMVLLKTAQINELLPFSAKEMFDSEGITADNRPN